MYSFHQDNQDSFPSAATVGVRSETLLLTQVLLWLAGALLLTAGGVFLSGLWATSSSDYLIMAIGVLGLCYFTQRTLMRGNLVLGSLLFAAFAVAEGVFLGPIVLTYLSINPSLVGSALTGTIGAFIICAAIVYSTNFITAMWGRVLFGALLVGILGLFVSFLIPSINPIVEMGLGVVFIGLTMFDFWRVKTAATAMAGAPAMGQTLSRGRFGGSFGMNPRSVYSSSPPVLAMALYLDFVNLFLIILRVLAMFNGGGGGRR